MKHYQRAMNGMACLMTALLCAGVIALLPEASAQTGSVTVLHSFSGPANGFFVTPPAEITFGQATLIPNQASLFLGADTNLYGVAPYGGTGGAGTLFKITQAGVLTTLRSFTKNGALGSNPLEPLVQASDGSFYGSTVAGGPSGGGVVFHIHADGTASIVQSFGYDGYAALVKGADGGIYGTIQPADLGTNGRVFKIAPNDTYTTLYDFTNTACSNPAPQLIVDSKGQIYSSAKGGNLGKGVLFTITPAGNFSILYNFGSQAGDGAAPSGLTLGKDGNFYGTTDHGGGKFFSVTPQGQLTNIAALSVGSAYDLPLTLGADGNFYGAVYYGEYPGLGLVFSITPAGAVKILHQFSGADGEYPLAPLTLGGDGNLYGTTTAGGSTNNGTIFRVTPGGGFTMLYDCAGGNDGYFPRQQLVQGPGGNLYGVTDFGGRKGWGAAFTLTPGGSVTILHEFSNDGIDGFGPSSSLTLASNGLLYGVTVVGGSEDNSGTLYSLSLRGNLSVVHDFLDFGSTIKDGGSPGGTLLAAKDGNLYGTAVSGGANYSGVVFALNPSTNGYSIFYNFGGSDGLEQPEFGVLQAMDGNFYGIAAAIPGGNAGVGATYEMPPSGGAASLLTLFALNGVGPAFPESGLIKASNGYFYGVTASGGRYGAGDAYRMTSGGSIEALHDFGAAGDGAYPVGGLMQASDGTFYGTTEQGGAYGLGTLFSMTPAGQVTILHSFNGADGAFPDAALLPAQDGSLYGVTEYGGANDAGVAFRFTLSPTGKFGISSLSRVGANTSHLVCYGMPNTAYRIESSPDMKSGYTTLATVTSDAKGAFQYDDATSVSARFYRLAYP